MVFKLQNSSTRRATSRDRAAVSGATRRRAEEASRSAREYGNFVKRLTGFHCDLFGNLKIEELIEMLPYY